MTDAGNAVPVHTLLGPTYTEADATYSVHGVGSSARQLRNVLALNTRTGLALRQLGLQFPTTTDVQECARAPIAI